MNAVKIVVAILLNCLQLAYADIPSQPLDAMALTNRVDAKRFTKLTNEVRCVVCQHQSIAESSSPIAEGMRRKIFELILAKKTNHEIKDYLVKRYGEYILLEPRLNSRTLILWAFPFIALAGASLILLMLFRHNST